MHPRLCDYACCRRNIAGTMFPWLHLRETGRLKRFSTPTLSGPARIERFKISRFMAGG